MHEHSDKIEPKKLTITIILAIILFGFGWYVTKNKKENSQKKIEINKTASTTLNELQN